MQHKGEKKGSEMLKSIPEIFRQFTSMMLLGSCKVKYLIIILLLIIAVKVSNKLCGTQSRYSYTF